MTSITLNTLLEEMARSEISSSYDISLDMLEKYANKLDWKGISRNESIPWTIDALQKFADRIDWNEFSQNCPADLIDNHFLQQFCDRLNWDVLSDYRIFCDNWDLLEKFADKVNWGKLIKDSSFWEHQNLDAFFERFQQYIPMSALLCSSSFLECMAYERSKALWLEMGGEKTEEF